MDIFHKSLKDIGAKRIFGFTSETKQRLYGMCSLLTRASAHSSTILPLKNGE